MLEHAGLVCFVCTARSSPAAFRVTPQGPCHDACAPAGDTLFVLGCGRLFEGSPQQMWMSLSKLLPLPSNTRVFCAHEYTQSNAKFALAANPGNAAVQQRKQQIDEMRAQVT